MSLSYQVGTVSALLGTTALQDRADVVAVSSQLNKTAGEAKAALLRRIAANQHVCICKDDGTVVGYHTFGAASTFTIPSDIKTAIASTSVAESACDVGIRMYVHADNLGQGIEAELLKQRATYQISNSITHSISFEDTVSTPAVRVGSTSIEDGRFLTDISVSETTAPRPIVWNWSGNVVGRTDLSVVDETGEAVHLWPHSFFTA